MSCAADEYRRATGLLLEGGVVAAPTDTVFGLIAVAMDAAAVERVFDIKGRDDGKPLPLFVGSIDQAALVAELTPAAEALAQRFWPGALTLVLRKRPSFETRAVAGADTVGLRVPGDAFLREAAMQLGPLTATSANLAGQPECRTADEVRAQLGESVDHVVDAPIGSAGKPSTVVDCTGSDVVVLREGAIPREAIAEALAGVAAVR
jgi:L-threonylcarbamoyladenylate synthase